MVHPNPFFGPNPLIVPFFSFLLVPWTFCRFDDLLLFALWPRAESIQSSPTRPELQRIHFSINLIRANDPRSRTGTNKRIKNSHPIEHVAIKLSLQWNARSVPAPTTSHPQLLQPNVSPASSIPDKWHGCIVSSDGLQPKSDGLHLVASIATSSFLIL